MAVRDTFVINSGDSSATVSGSGDTGKVAGYDVITDFVVGSDLINVAGAPFAAGDTRFDGTDSSLTIGGLTIKSDAISNGIITFSTFDSFSAPLTLSSTAKWRPLLTICSITISAMLARP